MLESLNVVNAAKTVRQSGDDAFIRVRFYKQTLIKGVSPKRLTVFTTSSPLKSFSRFSIKTIMRFKISRCLTHIEHVLDLVTR